MEEAKAAIYKFREGCVADEEIDAEFEALQLALRLESEQGKYMELFQGVNEKRTAIVVAMNFSSKPPVKLLHQHTEQFSLRGSARSILSTCPLLCPSSTSRLLALVYFSTIVSGEGQLIQSNTIARSI